jgi:NAD(P)-dependent dehydrogenase (short-subunit alcohol dehydrogenase family)
VRTAVVTGGSRGIGFSVSRQLVQAGVNVVITGRDIASLEAARREIGAAGQVRVLSFDAADPDAVERALHPLDVDILVANVGTGFSASVHDTTLEEWNRVLSTNVTSAFLSVSAVLDGMLERGWGRIVTVGSMASHVPLRYAAAYVASKHALLGLTRALAEDTRGRGVTVNMVAPAFVRTDMTERNISTITSKSGLTADAAEAKLAELSSLKRLLEPDEVAAEVLRLALDDSGETTGESVPMGFVVPSV